MYIVDVQGFQYKTIPFICKEIAILNTCNKTFHHAILNFPIDQEWMNNQVIKYMNRTTDIQHGLYWNSRNENFLNYEELSKFIVESIPYSDDLVLVKGLIKKNWLQKFISNNIVDVFNEGCPKLKQLKKIDNDFHNYNCNNHVYSKLQCAQENVYLIFKWYFLIKK